MKPISTTADPLQQPVSLTLEQALQQAIFHHQAGRLQDAEYLYRAILQAQPNHPDVNHNLGVLALQVRQPAVGIPHFKAALEANPNKDQFWLSYIDALIQTGQTDAAQQVLAQSQCQILNGGAVEAFAGRHNNIGITLQELGRLNEAEVSYRRAIQLKPDYVEAHSNLAVTLQELGRLNEAEASCRRALQIKPDYVEAHFNLGNILNDLCRLDEADSSYRLALGFKPECLAYAAKTHLLLPIIPETKETITYWRQRYQTGISELAAGDFNEEVGRLSSLSFYLAYHNQNDKPLMEELSRMFRKRASCLTAKAPHATNWQNPAASNQRIRVGVLSQFLVGHTIGKLFQGFIHHLDRDRFEVVVIHAPKAKRDTIRQSIDTFADRVLILPPGLKAQQAAVMAERLDVLFYPDIGMSQDTYFLAYARLAPVQVVSWGHPDTTGLDSMDYFVSATSIEPPDADEHYTERLIRLSRMPCFYQPLVALTQIPTRQQLGLPESGTLYGCPQSLFKIHPDFDQVLAAIAEGDPDGHIVLIEGKNAAWANLLKARWSTRFPILLDRVIFLPSLPLERFMALMAHIDVLLDPIHFGSGNTMYEAMVYGTPVITLPGEFMRGRLVAGCYKQMGISNPPIAKCLGDYAKIALELGLEPEQRRKLRNDLLEAASKELFSDMRAVREFELFLLAAVNAAERGEKIPAGWRPSSVDGVFTENLRART